MKDIYPIHETIPLYKVKAGDTCIIKGIARTVSSEFIKYDPFLGVTIWGCLAPKGIVRVLYPKWFKDEFIGYVPQP